MPFLRAGGNTNLTIILYLNLLFLIFLTNTPCASKHPNNTQKRVLDYKEIDRGLNLRPLTPEAIALNTVPRFTGKTRITGKTAAIPERPKSNRETLIGDY